MADTNNGNEKHSDWLIMIYLAGDNNLSANSIALLQNLEDVEALKHDKKVRVLAAFDSATPIPKGARYVEIRRDAERRGAFAQKIEWPLHNDLLTPDNIVVSPDFCGDPGATAKPVVEPTAAEALARFLKFARTHYEAKRYMLILFGHGTLVAGNTFLTDTSPPSFLKLDDFANILRTHFGQKIDILGFDNCVMNGIETAVQLFNKPDTNPDPLVDFTIGSQGLMLALGWPFRKIIETVSENREDDTKKLVVKILKECARNLLDFTLMERSSEQAVCDLTSNFGKDDKFISAVRQLSGRLQSGLEFDEKHELKFPIVRDVVRQARLEAQAYFGETFVDLYDFCELLILRCNDVLSNLNSLVRSPVGRLFRESIPKENGETPESFKRFLLDWEDLKEVEKIADAASEVLKIFKREGEEIVPRAYYVCPQLQYSHGLSIYFPWTLPEGPITFTPVSGSRPQATNFNFTQPTNFNFTPPFDVYRNYLFATPEFGDWAAFLEAFFRATLRNVRRVEFNYEKDDKLFFRGAPIFNDHERRVAAVDLQKTDSDTGEDDLTSFPPIKNYPRRFYLSPIDCKDKLPVFGLPATPDIVPTVTNVTAPNGKVSYLGWNIRGLVAELLGLPKTPQPPPEPPGGNNGKRKRG